MPSSVDVQSGLCWTWLETLKTGFLIPRLNLNSNGDITGSDSESMESGFTIMPEHAQETLRSQRRTRRPQRFGEYLIKQREDISETGMF